MKYPGRSAVLPWLPNFPGGGAAIPKLVQVLRFLIGVHRLPEALMAVGVELGVAHEIVHGVTLQHDVGVGREVVKQAVFANHVATVDEGVFELGFFRKRVNLAIFFDAESTEAAGGVDGGKGADFAGSFVGSDAGVDFDGAQAVAVSEEKCFALRDVALDGFDAEGRHGVLAGIGQRNGPIFFVVTVMAGDFGSVTKFEGDVAGVPEIVPEVIFDHVTLVPKAEDEFLVPVVGVGLHNMPENRPTANGHHRLGPVLRFFT